MKPSEYTDEMKLALADNLLNSCCWNGTIGDAICAFGNYYENENKPTLTKKQVREAIDAACNPPVNPKQPREILPTSIGTMIKAFLDIK